LQSPQIASSRFARFASIGGTSLRRIHACAIGPVFALSEPASRPVITPMIGSPVSSDGPR
jgi:hypothetical protein